MFFEGVGVVVRLAWLLLVQDVQELAVDIGLTFEALLGGKEGRTRVCPNVPETPHHRSLIPQANKTNPPHPLRKKKEEEEGRSAPSLP